VAVAATAGSTLCLTAPRSLSHNRPCASVVLCCVVLCHHRSLRCSFCQRSWQKHLLMCTGPQVRLMLLLLTQPLLFSALLSLLAVVTHLRSCCC
jgi:hypothetical protein